MGSNTVLSTALTWFLVKSILWQSSVAIWLNLPASGPKCVSEEIQNNVIVLADYHVISSNASSTAEDKGVSVKVTSPYGNDLYHRDNVTRGQFAFTTHETGNYLACFWVEEGSHHMKKKEEEAAAAAEDLSISLDWKTGIAAKDWDLVAKKEKIEGVELELRKLEGAVEAIHENLIYLKAKEAQMREVDETTNARVAWFSILSLAVCITVAICQLLYLKRYFQKKKLV